MSGVSTWTESDTGSTTAFAVRGWKFFRFGIQAGVVALAFDERGATFDPNRFSRSPTRLERSDIASFPASADRTRLTRLALFEDRNACRAAAQSSVAAYAASDAPPGQGYPCSP